MKFWSMIFVVAVLSTAIGTSIYYMGIAKLGATRASSYQLLVPAMALGSSYLILGETRVERLSEIMRLDANDTEVFWEKYQAF